MNTFDKIFFSRYITSREEIKWVLHKHIIVILTPVILTVFFLVIIPSFIYSQDLLNIKHYLEFKYFLLYIVLVYLYLIYIIFDWYNDVWIVTHTSVITIDWSLWTINTWYVRLEDIQWIEIEQNSIKDWILWKWDIQCLLVADQDNFTLIDVSNPQKSADFIREIQHEILWDFDDEDEGEEFEIMKHTLAEMVKAHCEWKNCSDNYSEEKNENELKALELELERVKSKKWTIDLR